MTIHVALLEPDIPWNTGNAGRTCLATGARLHLIRPLGFSLDERRVRRAGLDYWPHVEPVVWPSWTAFEEGLAGLGQPFFFSAEGERDFWSVSYPPSPVLIFGSETRSLPLALRRRYAQDLIALPMHPSPVRSLNVSTALAVAVYEVLRQQRERSRG